MDMINWDMLEMALWAALASGDEGDGDGDERVGVSEMETSGSGDGRHLAHHARVQWNPVESEEETGRQDNRGRWVRKMARKKGGAQRHFPSLVQRHCSGASLT